MFAAILGRFLTSLAEWRLERSVDVATVEYLTGSRTVFGAISTPFRLGILYRALPLLLVLWSFSPLGGQASLRTLYLGQTNVTSEVAYMDIGPDSLPRMTNVEEALTRDTTKTLFVRAVLSPGYVPGSKSQWQDSFDNLFVPQLEAMAAIQDHHPGLIGFDLQESSDGWYGFGKGAWPLQKSSLIGLPTTGAILKGKSFLNIETSYVYSNCSLKRRGGHDFEPTWEERSEGTCNNRDDESIALALDADPEYDANDPSTAPRRIWFRFQDYNAECSMTTTYVEMNHTCEDQVCAFTAARRSRLKHPAETKTWLDGELKRPDGSVGTFCADFINAIQVGTLDPHSPLIVEQYVNRVSDQLKSYGQFARSDDIVISSVISQLLNTYALAYISPADITSAYVYLFAKNVTTDSVDRSAYRSLKYDPTWLGILITSSLAMFTAGIATVILNLKRRGPEILDSFTSLLRDNPYVSEETGPSTEDSPEKVRRLRKTRVMLGDVRSLEATGYVAVTTRTDGDGVQPLRFGRLYQ